jgi:peptidoglycan/LPS O-acetylase OafA/YrhL
MQARHIFPLTGIRLFAASWVVLYHFRGCLLELFPFLQPLAPFFGLGYEAVPLFFLLSGFILSHNYFSDYSLARHPKFVFLRFARLWPVHFVTLLLFVFGPDLFLLKSDSLKSIAEELLMIRSWFHNDLAWNYPAWSISAEWFAYIFIFPLAFILFRRIQSWLCLVIIVTLLLIAQTFLPPNLFPGKCGSIVFLFLAGSGLYRTYCLVKNPPAEIIGICGMFLLLSYVLFNKSLSVLILYVAFALLIFGLSYERGFLARILSAKIAVQGGLASYSLYMTHVLILRSYLFFSWEGSPQSAFARFIIFLTLVGALTGTAFVFHHYIEEPANTKLRRLVGKVRKKPLQTINTSPKT